MAANYLGGGGPETWMAEDGSMLYSPSALQGRRAYAMSLMRNQRETRNAGDGLNNAANSIFAAMLLKDADAADQKMLLQQKEGGDLFSKSMTTPGSTGAQQTYVQPGASTTTGYTPGTPITPSAWTDAINSKVPEEMRPYFQALYKGEGGMTGAKSSTGAWGGPQWLESTGKQYGLVGPGFDHRNDPERSTAAAVQFTNDNRAALAKALGREPTWQETALAHQQGAGGAIKLLTNPNARAGDVVPARNLQVNRIDPNLNAGAAAQQIMRYYNIPQSQQGAPPVQVAQGGPSMNMPVQMGPGVTSYGGGTGSGITPQHIAAAKWAMANPSIATAEQKAMAQDIFKRAQEPGAWQDLGNGMFRTPEGNLVHRQGSPIIQDNKAFQQDAYGNLKPLPVQTAGGQEGGPGFGGYASPNQIGLSDQQKETLKFYSGQREKHVAGMQQAASERQKLNALQSALNMVAQRGPVAEALQPFREVGASFGIKDIQAVKGQEAMAIRQSMNDIVNEMFTRGAISDGDRKAALQAVAGIGSFKNTEKALMDVLYNANSRRIGLGQISTLYNQGKLNDPTFIKYHDLIANDPNVSKNFMVDSETGEVSYFNPQTRREEIVVPGVRR